MDAVLQGRGRGVEAVRSRDVFVEHSFDWWNARRAPSRDVFVDQGTCRTGLSGVRDVPYLDVFVDQSVSRRVRATACRSRAYDSVCVGAGERRSRRHFQKGVDALNRSPTKKGNRRIRSNGSIS
jgi:hypothetical protein